MGTTTKRHGSGLWAKIQRAFNKQVGIGKLTSVLIVDKKGRKVACFGQHVRDGAIFQAFRLNTSWSVHYALHEELRAQGDQDGFFVLLQDVDPEEENHDDRFVAIIGSEWGNQEEAPVTFHIPA